MICVVAEEASGGGVTTQTQAADAAAAPSTRFEAYLFTQGAWFLAFGVQVVLFPYLLRVVLDESEGRFGLAQMALQLPTTLLILIGGVVADRIAPRRIVIVCCGLAVLTFLALGGLVTSGRLTYGLMIGYALTVGVLSAFATPARDSLLSLVAPDRGAGSVQRAVTLAALAQYVAQILGMLVAAAAPLFGVGPLLLGQAGLMAVATLSAVSLRPRPAVPVVRGAGGNALGRLAADVGGGLSAVVASPIIGPLTACATAMGVCFMGSFFVLLPLIVESYFTGVAGSDRTQIASGLALFSLCFWTGSLVSTLALMRLAPRRHVGRLYLGALASGGLILMACAIPVPFAAFCALNFAWGLGGGVAMTLGRGMVQQYAPPESRGRVLSVFTRGMMGGGPIGAAVYGYLAGAIGPRTAVLVPGALMLALVGLIAWRSRLASVGEAPAEG